MSLSPLGRLRSPPGLSATRAEESSKPGRPFDLRVGLPMREPGRDEAVRIYLMRLTCRDNETAMLVLYSRPIH